MSVIVLPFFTKEGKQKTSTVTMQACVIVPYRMKGAGRHSVYARHTLDHTHTRHTHVKEAVTSTDYQRYLQLKTVSYAN